MGMLTSSVLRRAATTTSTAHPRIAIVGGGPGGLTLLLTLHKRGIPATLYEREPSFASRSHLGGSLDLGYDTGQRALRENGLEQQFKGASVLLHKTPGLPPAFRRLWADSRLLDMAQQLLGGRHVDVAGHPGV